MIATREQVKTFLQITGTEQDDLIDALLPVVEADYEHIRNASFDVDEETEDIVYPEGSAYTAALMVGYALNSQRVSSGLQSESLGDYSYTRADSAGDSYPEAITGRIRRFVRAQ